MKRKILLTIPIAILAILATLAIAGTVEAHNAAATPSCGGLSWSAVNYDKTVTNSIVVKVDGTTVHQDLDFKSSDDGTSPWSQTAPHTWSVVINAPATQYDRSFSGVWQACQAAPTTTVAQTVPATTTTAPQATTVPDTTVATTVGSDPTTTVPTVDQCCVVVPTTLTPPPVADVVSLTPAEPVLPRTGLDGFTGGLVAIAFTFLVVGTFLAIRGRRVP